MNNFIELAAARFSTRAYTEKAVEEEKLEQILQAAKLAPTAKNNQPQKIYVVRSSEGLAKLNKLTRCIYGASTVFLLSYDRDRDWKSEEEPGVHSGEWDVSIVATHMALAATDLGLGSCIIGWFAPSEAAKAFDLPENIRPVLMLSVGYTSEKFKPAPMHTQYRNEDDVVSYL